MRRNSIVGAIALALFVTGCGSSVSQQVQVAKLGVKKLDKAVQEYSAKKGSPPASLTDLVEEGLVGHADIHDPWDQEYQYDPNGNKHKSKKPDIWTTSPDQSCTVMN